ENRLAGHWNQRFGLCVRVRPEPCAYAGYRNNSFHGRKIRQNQALPLLSMDAIPLRDGIHDQRDNLEIRFFLLTCQVMIKKHSYPETRILKRYEEIISAFPEVELKGVSMPYTAVNGNMFSFLSKEG